MQTPNITENTLWLPSRAAFSLAQELGYTGNIKQLTMLGYRIQAIKRAPDNIHILFNKHVLTGYLTPVKIPEGWATIKDISEKYGLSINTLYSRVAANKIKSMVIKGRKYVFIADVEEYIQQNEK